MPVEFWSWLLTGTGCCAMLLAGSGKLGGWILALCAQPAWIIYSIITRQYGFIVGALLYGSVYIRNIVVSHQRKVKSNAE